MKFSFFLFLFHFLFSFSAAHAQYEQVVRPIRIQEIVDYSKYKFRQAMNSFFKSASLITQVSPTQLDLTATLSCANRGLTGGVSQLFVARTAVPSDAKSRPSLKESLYLKACNRRVELFSIERVGSTVTAASDSDLIRGIIPDSANAEVYRLSFMDRKMTFEISQTLKEQELQFAITILENVADVQVQILESLPAAPLAHQYLRFIYQSYGRIAQDIDKEYIWNLDPRNAVPRQYFYRQQKEISPADFLLLKDAFFSQTIYPLIDGQMGFYLNLF